MQETSPPVPIQITEVLPPYYQRRATNCNLQNILLYAHLQFSPGATSDLKGEPYVKGWLLTNSSFLSIIIFGVFFLSQLNPDH